MDLPRQLGRYRLVRRLGRGGMAEVFQAVAVGASGFEKLVAIKMLLPELQGSGEFERLLIEEARLGARLSHRNLVQVHDLATDDGAYFVRMDYVDGADLGALLRAGPPPLALALLIAEEIAQALSYVHALADEAGRPLGLVHRDVNPSNVLLSRSGEVKLADFGIAKATMLAEVTRGNLRKGKYSYMSPEQIVGAAIAAPSDQFGLGVTLAELLLGRRPFDGDTPHETMERVRLAHPPELGDAVPPAIAAVIHRCLARDPAQRFPTTEALRRALTVARCSSAEPAAAPELGRWVVERLA